MSKKNKKYIIIGIIIVIVFTVLFVVIKNSKKEEKKSFNISSITDFIVKGYDDLREMDFIDITTLFGMSNVSEEDEALFFTNIDLTSGIDTNSVMVIVVNTDNESDYYGVFDSFLTSYKYNTDEKELLDFYDTVILKQGDGFVYFLMGENPELFEREIYSFYY